MKRPKSTSSSTKHRRRHTKPRRVGGAGKTQKLQMNNGLIYAIKRSIAGRLSILVNSQVTSRIQDRFLTGLPPTIQANLKGEIDNVTIQIVKDMTTKALSVGENIMKSVPGIGNAFSFVAAVDKAIAAVKNVKAAIHKIAADVENAKNEMRMMGMDPNQLSMGIPQVPQMPQVPQIPQAGPLPMPPKLALPAAPDTSGIANQTINSIKKGGDASKYSHIIDRTTNSIERFRRSGAHSSR